MFTGHQVLGTGSHTQLRKQPARTSSPSAAPPGQRATLTRPQTRPPPAGAPPTSLLSPPLLRLFACSDCCLSTQSRTLGCQQKHTWRWWHLPTPCHQHIPTRAVCRCLSWVRTRLHQLLPTQLGLQLVRALSRLVLPNVLLSSEGTRTSHGLPSDLGRPAVACCCEISGNEFNLSERQMLHCRLGIITASRRWTYVPFMRALWPGSVRAFPIGFEA